MNRKPTDARAAAKRAALRALRRARLAAARTGAELSAWEGEFLTSVEERLGAFGRAFGDPEKGAPGAALSTLQGVKLKQIAAKAKGEPTVRPDSCPGSAPGPRRRGFQRGARSDPSD